MNSDFGMVEQGNPRYQIAVLKLNGPIAQSRLERTPDKREVVGSIPTRPTILWGCSSVGRAPALHAGGHRFDPVHLHHKEVQS